MRMVMTQFLWMTLDNIINGLYNMYTFVSASPLLGIYFLEMPRDVCKDVCSRTHYLQEPGENCKYMYIFEN